MSLALSGEIANVPTRRRVVTTAVIHRKPGRCELRLATLACFDSQGRKITNMKLAYTMAPGRGDMDLVLEGLAAGLASRGLKCCGTVQIDTERADAAPCDMDVRVLSSGPVCASARTSASRRGGRLDPAALETVVRFVAERHSCGADILIVNKFGKHEAKGAGVAT